MPHTIAGGDEKPLTSDGGRQRTPSGSLNLLNRSPSSYLRLQEAQQQQSAYTYPPVRGSDDTVAMSDIYSNGRSAMLKEETAGSMHGIPEARMGGNGGYQSQSASLRPYPLTQLFPSPHPYSAAHEYSAAQTVRLSPNYGSHPPYPPSTSTSTTTSPNAFLTQPNTLSPHDFPSPHPTGSLRATPMTRSARSSATVNPDEWHDAMTGEEDRWRPVSGVGIVGNPRLY